MNPVYLAICAIVRKEAPYIGEWIEFHRLVGIQRFYLVDDGSTDGTADEIRWHDREDIVLQRYRHDDSFRCPEDVPFRATHQVLAFNRFIQERKDEAVWCAFIDVDEFLYHVEKDDIRDPLFEEIESRGAAGLFVNWLIFGSNGHRTKPPGPTIAAYTRRGHLGAPEPTGRHGKLIARLDALAHFGAYGSHNATFRQGHAINETGRAVRGPTNPEPSVNRWRVNHYYHRSSAEARARVRAVDNNCVPGYAKTRARLRRHDLNDVDDREILRFLPRLMEVTA